MSEDIDAMVLELLEAGVQPTLAASIVARAFVAGVHAAPFRVDASAERRREKDRERKQNVRRLPRNSADKSGDDPPPKVPPITPLNTPSAPNGAGADAPSDPSVEEREFFRRGKQVLGNSAGGLLAQLKRVKGNNIPLARAALESASQTHNPREYVGRIIAGQRSIAALDFNGQPCTPGIV